MEDNGMETAFRVYNPDLKTEVYLLDNWGSAEDGKVSKWVQTLTTMGFGYVKGNCLPVGNFNFNNPPGNGKAALVSITLEIWYTIKKYLGYDAYGPKVFCVIIKK